MENDLPTSGTILSVDDHPVNLAIIEKVLASVLGVKVCSVMDGESAIHHAVEETPSLVLLDVMMPGLDGFETCRRLKDVCPDVPVIFMTALSDGDSIAKGFDVGGADYVTKPFQEAELIARVATQLRLQSLLAGLRQNNEQLQREVEGRLVAEAALRELNREMQVQQMNLVCQERASEISRWLTMILPHLRQGDGDFANVIDALESVATSSGGNLNKLLDHLLLLMQPRLEGCGIEVEKRYSALPSISGKANLSLCFAFLHLIENILDEMQGVVGDRRILVTTTWVRNEDASWVSVSIKRADANLLGKGLKEVISDDYQILVHHVITNLYGGRIRFTPFVEVKLPGIEW